MNPIKIIFLIISFQMFSLTGFGQFEENQWKAVSEKSNTFKRKISGKKYIYKLTNKGTQFYHSDWLPGTIIFEDGEIIEDVMIRYNSYIDELVYFNNNIKSLLTVDKYLIKEFTVRSPLYGIQRFRKMHFENSPEKEKYFNVLYEGEITLLARFATKEKKISVYKDKYGFLRDSELIQTETFYTYTLDNGFKKFIPRRSSFLKMYKNNKSQVRQIMRRNRVNKFNIPQLKRMFFLIEEAGITL